MTEFSNKNIKKDFMMRLESGLEIDIMYGLIGIGMHLNDYNYVIDQCRKLLDTDSTIILRGVIFALGHLSRNFDSVDYDLINLAIQKGLNSGDEITIDAAKNFKEDLEASRN